MINPLGEPVGEKIVQAIFEPILLGIIEKLRAEGWTVELNHGETGYLIVFALPGESKQSTAAGENAKQALDDLMRNLTQIGALPKELREMAQQVDQQTQQVRDAVADQLKNDLKATFDD